MTLVILVLGTAIAGAAQQSDGPPAATVEAAQAILDAGAKHKNPDTRKETAAAIGLIGYSKEVVAGLAELLKDPDYQVRQAAVGALADLNHPSAVPLLASALEDSVAEVAFLAARHLWAMKDPRGRELLHDVVDKEQKGSSNPLVTTWRKTTRQFKTPKSALMYSVRQGIGFVPVPGLGFGYSAAMSMLLDPSLTPRATALLLLANDASEDVCTLARRGLKDDDWTLRAVAVQVLAQQGSIEDRPALADLFDDRREKVRLRAAAAYLRLGLAAGR